MRPENLKGWRRNVCTLSICQPPQKYNPFHSPCEALLWNPSRYFPTYELAEVAVTRQVEYVRICSTGRPHTPLHTTTRPLYVCSMKTSPRDFCKFWGNPDVLPRVSRVLPSSFSASIWKGLKRGSVAVCKRMCGLPAEQIQTYSTCRVTTTSTNSRT